MDWHIQLSVPDGDPSSRVIQFSRTIEGHVEDTMIRISGHAVAQIAFIIGAALRASLD